MNTTDPVRRVSVVSTGQVQIRPDHEASNWRPMAWWLLASRRWTGPQPINAYVSGPAVLGKDPYRATDLLWH